jgi:hypothetical protein
MFTEDLDVFFNQAGHAVAAVYDAAGANTSISVIFDEPHLEQVGIGGTNPVAQAKASDIPATGAIGKTLTIGGTVFVIRARQPVDDGAVVELQLER